MSESSDKNHIWLVTTLVRIYTCEKCGLLKLTTHNGNYYFVRFSEPYLQCNTPSRIDQTQDASS